MWKIFLGILNRKGGLEPDNGHPQCQAKEYGPLYRQLFLEDFWWVKHLTNLHFWSAFGHWKDNEAGRLVMSCIQHNMSRNFTMSTFWMVLNSQWVNLNELAERAIAYCLNCWEFSTNCSFEIYFTTISHLPTAIHPALPHLLLAPQEICLVTMPKNTGCRD